MDVASSGQATLSRLEKGDVRAVDEPVYGCGRNRPPIPCRSAHWAMVRRAGSVNDLSTDWCNRSNSRRSAGCRSLGRVSL